MIRLAPLALALPLSACLVGGLEGQYMNDLGYCTARDPAPDAAPAKMLNPAVITGDGEECRFDDPVPLDRPGRSVVAATCWPEDGGAATRRVFAIAVARDGAVTLTDTGTGMAYGGGPFRRCPAGPRAWF